MRLRNFFVRAVGGLAVLFAQSVGSATASAGEPFDYFVNSWQVIGLKDYQDGTRITPQNELLLGDKSKLRISVGSHLIPLGREQTKTLLDGWLPIVLLTTEQDDVRYEFTLWATPLPTVKDWRASFDWPTEGENFLNWIQIKAHNLGTKPGEASVLLEWAGTNAARLAEWRTPIKPRQTATTCFRFPFARASGARTAMSADAPAPPRTWRSALRTQR